MAIPPARPDDRLIYRTGLPIIIARSSREHHHHGHHQYRQGPLHRVRGLRSRLSCGRRRRRRRHPRNRPGAGAVLHRVRALRGLLPVGRARARGGRRHPRGGRRGSARRARPIPEVAAVGPALYRRARPPRDDRGDPRCRPVRPLGRQPAARRLARGPRPGRGAAPRRPHRRLDAARSGVRGPADAACRLRAADRRMGPGQGPDLPRRAPPDRRPRPGPVRARGRHHRPHLGRRGRSGLWRRHLLGRLPDDRGRPLASPSGRRSPFRRAGCRPTR